MEHEGNPPTLWFNLVILHVSNARLKSIDV